MPRHATLTASLAASGALLVALAPAALAEQPADGAAFLAERLEANDDRLKAEFGGESYDDLGLTLDAIFSITATGTADAQAAASTQYVVSNAGAYYGTGEDVYAGATAKLLTAATARGLDPRAVGGVDLVERLQSLEQESGQFADASQWGDYSNSLGQSFALIGLSRAGANPSTAAVDFLLAQQCADGGFSLDYVDGCVSDPDATSVAIQALSVVGGHDDVVAAAADYLEGKQGTNGGLGGGATTEGPNANSTGLAAMAFRAAGRDAAAVKAQGFLQSLALGCATPQLAGAIAYDPAAKAELEAKGAAATADDQTTRSSAQALIGLTDQTYVTVSAEGASEAVVAPDCGSTGEPTDDPAEPTATPSGDDETPGPQPTQDGDDPARPEVVQTDSGAPADGAPVAVLGALGLLGLASAGSSVALAATARGGARR